MYFDTLDKTGIETLLVGGYRYRINFMGQGRSQTHVNFAVHYLKTFTSNISDGQKCKNVGGAASGQAGPVRQDAQQLPALESGARGDHIYYINIVGCVCVCKVSLAHFSQSFLLPHHR